MSTQKKSLRRSGAKIMASLIALLGSLSYIMVLAVINGSVGFVCAMGVTVFGAAGVSKRAGGADCAFLRVDHRSYDRLRCSSRSASLFRAVFQPLYRVQTFGGFKR